MNALLCSKINKAVDDLKIELLKNVPLWSDIRTPSELFDLEQELQKTLNFFQTKLIGAVFDAIHQDKAFVRKCQRQALSVDSSHKNRGGWVDVSIQTLGGQKYKIRTPYLPPRKKKDSGSREEKLIKEGSGIFPVLRKLGIVGRATPRLIAETSRQLADGPSTVEAKERLINREIIYSQEPIWRHTRDFTSIALYQRQEALKSINQTIKISQKSSFEGKIVVIGLDGGRLRIRIDKESNTQKKHKKYTTNQCEAKIFVVYVTDKKGNKSTKEEFIYEGTILPIDYMLALLRFRLKEMNIARAESLVFIGDGSSWIWKRIPWICADLELGKLPVFEIVDFFHVVGKFTKPAKLGLQTDTQRKKWLRQLRKFLKEGKIDEIIKALKLLDRSQDTADDIRKTIEYIRTHRERMQYAEFEAKGFPIGSGVIESAVRRIVNLRLKGTGIFWRPETAEGLLYLRCQIKGGHWIPFVKSVLTQWADDMTISMAQAQEIREHISTKFLESHHPIDPKELHNEAIQWARNVLEEKTALIIDTETTGLEDNDEIIQIAIIDTRGHVLLDTFVKPTKEISPKACAVHGIEEKHLTHALTFAELYHSIAKLLCKQSLIAYNAEFDKRLLMQTCEKYGLSEIEILDWTCAMEKYAYFWGKRQADKFRRQNLSLACKQQDLPVTNAHNAVNDCLLTLKLIQVMANAEKRDFL